MFFHKNFVTDQLFLSLIVSVLVKCFQIFFFITIIIIELHQRYYFQNKNGMLSFPNL